MKISEFQMNRQIDGAFAAAGLTPAGSKLKKFAPPGKAKILTDEDCLSAVSTEFSYLHKEPFIAEKLQTGVLPVSARQ